MVPAGVLSPGDANSCGDILGGSVGGGVVGPAVSGPEVAPGGPFVAGFPSESTLVSSAIWGALNLLDYLQP